MITADRFEMVEAVTREQLERHPVWCPFDDDDRVTLLGWGVPEERLDRELERLASCGTRPLFPVLAPGGLPANRPRVVAARFRTASGRSLRGYLHRPHAFGLFAGDREFCFNVHLQGASRRAGERLAAAIGERPEDLFPLRYHCEEAGGAEPPLAGEIERIW